VVKGVDETTDVDLVCPPDQMSRNSEVGGIRSALAFLRLDAGGKPEADEIKNAPVDLLSDAYAAGI
jgi:hypothetical protein